MSNENKGNFQREIGMRIVEYENTVFENEEPSGDVYADCMMIIDDARKALEEALREGKIKEELKKWFGGKL